MSQQTHRSDPQVLTRRTLQRDHRTLASLLRPGMAVLDVGCGTGAITAGIAQMVAPGGHATGLDRDEALLAIGKREYQDVENLSFECRDILALDFENRFDVVTAARTLQWISEPQQAVRLMKRAATVGGLIVVLDYNHADNTWEPAPPPEFATFYKAFLDWRAANKWDNNMAAHLPDLFQSEGLAEIRVHDDDETVLRGDPDFPAVTATWAHVIESVGPRIVAAEFLTGQERLNAAEAYQRYMHDGLQKQTHSMRTVEGRHL